MDTSLFTLTAVVLLLGANAFFVAAEFALVKARGFRIEALALEGGRAAGMTRRILGRLEAYLAACQLGITMASLGLGWIGEPAVAAVLEPVFLDLGLPDRLLHTVSFIIGFIIFSSLHIVVGEQVPKTFAIRKPEPVSLLCAYPLHAFFVLMYPLNWALNRASGAILSLFKVDEATHGDVLTDEELRGLITVSKEHGHIAEDKAAMLANLFAFDERTVGRVMIPRGDVQMLVVNGEPDDNARVMLETQHSRFPVVEDVRGNPIGMVLAKELFGAVLNGETLPWGRLKEFVREPLFVPETLRIAQLFDTMRAARLHMAFVVDEYGDFVGLVTLEDLLEEIVGDIADETDEVETEYTISESGDGWEAHGLAPLGDVQRVTGMNVPHELDANTLSGLFIQRLRRMPQLGDRLDEDGFELTVTGVEEQHVASVNIKASAPPAEMQPDEASDGPQTDN